jgi:hypothetical protein
MAAEEDEAGSRMSMQLVLMNCLKDKKYGDALSACNSLLARFPTDAMALECKTLLTEKAELAEMPTRTMTRRVVTTRKKARAEGRSRTTDH